MTDIVEVEALSRWFGKKQALANVSYRAGKGLVGVNDAGKTTSSNTCSDCCGPGPVPCASLAETPRVIPSKCCWRWVISPKSVTCRTG